jgi:hypothetical protein
MFFDTYKSNLVDNIFQFQYLSFHTLGLFMDTEYVRNYPSSELCISFLRTQLSL